MYSTRFKKYSQNPDMMNQKNDLEKEKEEDIFKTIDKNNNKIVEEVIQRRLRRIRFNIHNDDKEKEKKN